MDINIYDNKEITSQKAAEKAAQILKETISEKGKANFVVATGASQFDFLRYLTNFKDIDWSKTEMYHLDEYIGISDKHKASFRNYLDKRLISQVEIGEINLINGNIEDPEEECKRLNKKISEIEIDVSFVGIGENGHLAFNDPPADFETEKPFIIVDLNTECRQQQVNEGWFDSLEDVPERAITMSINQIMKSQNIICTVPGERKAQAVKDCFTGDKVSENYPASILKKHKSTYIFLDTDSARLINND